MLEAKPEITTEWVRASQKDFFSHYTSVFNYDDCEKLQRETVCL